MADGPHSKTLRPSVHNSVVTAISGATTITMSTTGDDKGRRTHGFAAVEFYSDSGGTTVVEGTAGDLTFTLKTTLLPEQYVAFTNNTVANILTNTIVSWDANTDEVKVVIDNVTGDPTHARLRVIMNGV